HRGLQVVDVALQGRLTGVFDRAYARENAFEITFLRPDFRVEVGEAREVAERDAAFGRELEPRAEALEPLEHVLLPADALAVLAVAHDVDAGGDLLRGDLVHGAAQGGQVFAIVDLAVDAPAQQRTEVVGPHEA